MPEAIEKNDLRNPYISGYDKPEIKDSIVAYVDILGYSERVRQAQEEGRSQAQLAEFHTILSKSFYRLNGLADDGEPLFEGPWPGNQKHDSKIRIFSDKIVIGCPIGRVNIYNKVINGYSQLRSLIDGLAFFQFEMASQGFFVRGAVTVGELYMDDLIIYGQALVVAYNAESQETRDPRIILTDSARRMIEEHDNSLHEEDCKDQSRSEYINDIYKDADGKLFLNYLETVLVGDDRLQFTDELEAHKKIVEERLREFCSQPRYWYKYAWVANYHNFFCEQNSFGDEYKVDLSQYQMQPTRRK